jgi:hypothetical protein
MFVLMLFWVVMASLLVLHDYMAPFAAAYNIWVSKLLQRTLLSLRPDTQFFNSRVQHDVRGNTEYIFVKRLYIPVSADDLTSNKCSDI